VKAITIRQPWASAIFLLDHAKDVENRPVRTKHLGPVAIHAGFRWDPAGQEAVLRIAGRMYIQAATGAVIGVAQVTGCHPTEPGCCDSPWAQPDARFHITLANPVKLLDPVLCRGAQGWWNLPDNVEAEVNRQLGQASDRAYPEVAG